MICPNGLDRLNSLMLFLINDPVFVPDRMHLANLWNLNTLKRNSTTYKSLQRAAGWCEAERISCPNSPWSALVERICVTYESA